MFDAPLSVTELTARIKQTLEQGFAHVCVIGEVSRPRYASSGHLYFTIKDQHAAISAVIWRSTLRRLDIRPEDGREFIFTGHLSVYEPRGSYQLVVTRLEASGAGRLAAEFERRKQAFAARGWFDASRKQRPPEIPVHIGIATSANAAALADVKKVLASRPGWLRLTLAPCLVQGDQAPASIARAIARLSRMQDPPDVILLVRGGGSLEDLWCFNDELVVKAIVDCPIPVITGIGHEIDVTLADFAADVRAATPSNAVELACPSRAALRERLPDIASVQRQVQQQIIRRRRDVRQLAQRQQHQLERRMDAAHHACVHGAQLLHYHFQSNLKRLRQQLRTLEKQLARFAPGRQLRNQRAIASKLAARLKLLPLRNQQQQRQRLRRYRETLSMQAATMLAPYRHVLLRETQRLRQQHRAITARRREAWKTSHQRLAPLARQRLGNMRQQLALLSGRLEALGPYQVLQRGYTLSYSADGRLLTSVAQLQPGATMRVRFHDGDAATKVQSVSRDRQ